MKPPEALVADVLKVLKAHGLGLDRPQQPLGRPRSTDRCPCQAMTAYRAAKRGHVCEAKEIKP